MLFRSVMNACGDNNGFSRFIPLLGIGASFYAYKLPKKQSQVVLDVENAKCECEISEFHFSVLKLEVKLELDSQTQQKFEYPVESDDCLCCSSFRCRCPCRSIHDSRFPKRKMSADSNACVCMINGTRS